MVCVSFKYTHIYPYFQISYTTRRVWMRTEKTMRAIQKLMGVYFIPGDEPAFEVALEEGSGYVPVTMEMYNNIAQQFQKQLTAGDEEYYIDQDWALAFLSSPENQLQ